MALEREQNDRVKTGKVSPLGPHPVFDDGLEKRTARSCRPSPDPLTEPFRWVVLMRFLAIIEVAAAADIRNTCCGTT